MSVSTFLLNSPDPEVYSQTDGIKRPDKVLPLGEVIKIVESDQIWAARGKAIQGYAQLEFSLCMLMQACGGLPDEAAKVIFYKIVNTSARNSIIEKLLHKKCGPKFNLFWNPFVKALRVIDTKRNEIVHWLAAAHAALNTDDMIITGVTLVPPASLGGTPTERILPKDLIAFQAKCDEISRLTAMFAMVIKPPDAFDEAAQKPWLDIFQQPFVYPLPADHPLNKQPPAPGIQPQSSPVSAPKEQG